MKKNFLSLGLIAAAAFTLTNCTQKLANPVEPSVDGVPFEIVASPVESKTTNDGISTVWAAGDAINVFHKLNEEGSTYKNDGKFEFVDGNTFKGTLTEALSEESNYNLYAFYPYNSNIQTPGERNKGYITVGSTSSGTQKQTGNNSMTHIAGENYPLGGVFIDWDAGSEVPVQIPMSHLSSLLEVVVKNQTGKPLVVESVSFTGSENIVGTYYIDLTGNAPVFTESGANYVSKTAKLEVLEGEQIPNGESAKFYLAIKPFWATGDISLAVNNIAKTKTFTTKSVSANEFVAGKIKTLNYTMLDTDVLETSKIEDAIKVTDNTIVQIEGLVIAKYDRGALIQDETGIMLVYNASAMDENVGDKVVVSGTKTTYGGFAQIKTPTVKVLSTGNAVTYPTPIVLDGAALDEQLEATSISYIQYTGKLSVSGTYYTITVDGATTAFGSVQYPESSLGLSSMNGETIKVTGYFIGVSSSKYINTMAISVEVIPTMSKPVITCSETGEVEITCPTEGAKIYYTTDGTQPSATNGTLYVGKFNVASETTVKAVAVKEGYIDSQVDSETYTASTVGPVTVSSTIANVATQNVWANGVKYEEVELDAVITASVSGGSNTGKYYTNGNNWRLYQLETPELTITADNGYTINTVKITYTVDKTGVLTYNNSNIASATTVNVNASSITFGVGNTDKTVTNGQVRVTAIEVVYQKN